jgi:hypothetical protein
VTPEDVPGGWAGVAAGFGSLAAGLLWLRRTWSRDSADGARHDGERDVISRYREQAEGLQAELSAVKAELAEERRLRLAAERSMVMLEGEAESLQAQLATAMKNGRKLAEAFALASPGNPHLQLLRSGFMPLDECGDHGAGT